MSTEPATTTTYVIQRREWGGNNTWHDVGEERGATDTELEQLRKDLAEQRKLWDHESQFRVVRIKRKTMDW